MKPATDLSKVDLPQPDGPRRMNFSPRPTEKVTSSTAVNSPFSVGYEMVTPRTRSRSVIVYPLGSPSCGSPRLRLRLLERAAPHPSGVYPLGSPSCGSPRLRLRLLERAAPRPSGVYPLGSPSAAPRPSVPRQAVERFEGVVAPGGPDGLDHADLVHERGELDEPRGWDGVPQARLLHDL